MPTARLIELIGRLANLFERDSRALALAGGLADPVHLAAVIYLARANRYSNTPAALAEYLGLTKGTVSQSLAVLERNGFLRKRDDPDDRRLVRLELTRKGAGLARRAARAGFGRAAERIPAARLAMVEETLTELLAEIQRAGGGRSFGVCRSCRHFLSEGGGFRCGLTGEPLAAPQIVKICREHAPAA